MFPIAELLRHANATIEAMAVRQPNGQVADQATERVVRWYQTRGLLDTPVTYRGRTALYTLRHVAQVVAIKRLQSEGRSLAEIERALAGLDDKALAGLAGVPIPSVPPAERDGVERDRPRGPFWAARPPAPSGLGDRAGPYRSSGDETPSPNGEAGHGPTATTARPTISSPEQRYETPGSAPPGESEHAHPHPSSTDPHLDPDNSAVPEPLPLPGPEVFGHVRLSFELPGGFTLTLPEGVPFDDAMSHAVLDVAAYLQALGHRPSTKEQP